MSLQLVSAPVLLVATFLLCAGGAIAAPAWLLMAPMLVDEGGLDSAVAINNVSSNVSRAVGPAIGGLAIALSKSVCPSGSILSPIWASWRAVLVAGAARTMESLPAERFVSAIESGVRYAATAATLARPSLRALAFFPVRQRLLGAAAADRAPAGRPRSAFYGVMFGAVGLGSIARIAGAQLAEGPLGPDRLAALGAVGTAIALCGFATAHNPTLALAASLLAGASWIITMTTLFISAQVALPSWVLGRGLAIFLTIYFGAMTVGSALWGKVANVEGLPWPSSSRPPAPSSQCRHLALETADGRGRDLTPSMHWRAPVFVQRVEDDSGPILLTLEYRIDPKDRTPSSWCSTTSGASGSATAPSPGASSRMSGDEGRIVETFLVRSLGELKHLRARVTVADRMIEEKARRYLLAPPNVGFLVAPRRERFARRKRAGRRLSASRTRRRKSRTPPRLRLPPRSSEIA